MVCRSKRFCFALMGMLLFLLTGCYRPPYNNFKPYHRVYQTTADGAIAGTAAFAMAGGPILVGTVAGAVLGAGVGYHKDSKAALFKALHRYRIQTVEYGDTVTLIVPTDRYFEFNSSRLYQGCFPGLAELVKLIKLYPPCCPIYVAGFTNAVGSHHHKKRLTQAQAETMLTFLWANGVAANRLHAEGYADKHAVSDNMLVHGSAQNRRLEIQLFTHCSPVLRPVNAWKGPLK